MNTHDPSSQGNTSRMALPMMPVRRMLEPGRGLRSSNAVVVETPFVKSGEQEIVRPRLS